MKALTRSTIAQAKEADALFLGEVRCGKDPPLFAPISGRRCVGWRIVVERQTAHQRWLEVLALDESVSFFLSDKTGVATVRDQPNTRLALASDHKGRSSLFGGVPTTLAALLTQNTIELEGALFPSAFRYQESVLQDGETVIVAGRARWVQDPSRAGEGYRDSGKQLHIAAMSDGVLRITDDPKLA